MLIFFLTLMTFSMIDDITFFMKLLLLCLRMLACINYAYFKMGLLHLSLVLVFYFSLIEFSVL
jgi:hypothetical protein